MKISILAIRFMAVAMSFVGCSESHGETDARAAQEAEVRVYVDALVEARCAREIYCEARSPGSAWIEAAECHPGSFGVDIVQGDLNRWLEGRTTFDAELASLCLAALEENCTSVPEWEICQQVFEGAGAVGADCSRIDCDDETYCTAVTGSPDACPPPERECVRRPAEGETCRRFSCLGDLRCVDGICLPPTPEGESCVASTFECESGTSCLDGVCAPNSVLVGRGESCAASTSCEDGLVCARPIPDELGACAEGVAPGDVCSRDAPCTLGLRCAEGTCRTISAGERPCGTEVCAYGFWCDGGSCVPQPLFDESCSEASGCLTGRCEGVCQPIPQGAPCVSPDPALLGSCEFQGCDPEIGICPTYVGEGEYCDRNAIRCRGSAVGEILTCETEGAAAETCVPLFPVCE